MVFISVKEGSIEWLRLTRSDSSAFIFTDDSEGLNYRWMADDSLGGIPWKLELSHFFTNLAMRFSKVAMVFGSI